MTTHSENAIAFMGSHRYGRLARLNFRIQERFNRAGRPVDADGNAVELPGARDDHR